jgi:hypothetical protein
MVTLAAGVCAPRSARENSGEPASDVPLVPLYVIGFPVMASLHLVP